MAGRSKLAAAICTLVLVSASGSACGMTLSQAHPDRCEVIGGDKLPAEVGGADALCGIVEAAIREKAPGRKYGIRVNVLSAFSLAATVTVKGGETLPEQKRAASNRQLNRAPIERSAPAVADAVAAAAAR